MMASHASKLPETAGIPRPPEIALHSLIFPVKEVFARGKICCFMPLPFSAAALFALEMRRTLGRPLVIITESAALMDEMRRNLDAFTAEKDAAAILDYPPREEDTAGGKGGKPSGRDSGRPAIAAGERLRALARIGVAQSPFLINTCVQALMQKTISPAALNRYALRLSEGKPHDPDRLAAWLEQAGYEFVPEVQEKAQAARRGGLADVWPPSEPLPLRIEFDGLTVESIRRFDAVDQRSCGRAGTVVIPPASESVLTRVPQISNLESQISNSYDSLAQCLPDETVFFWVEKCPAAADKSARQYGGIACHAALHESACRDAGFSGADVSFAALLENLSRRPCPQCFSVVDCSPWRSLAQTGLSPHILPDAFPSLDPGFRALHDMSPPLQSFLTVDAARENRRQWLGRLEEKARAGMDVHLFFSTPGALDRFRSANSPGRDVFHFHLGAVSDGFLHDQLRLAVVSEPGLLFQAKTMRRRAEIKAQRLAERRAVSGETITDRVHIEPGDLVVHVRHGIGQYLGLSEIVFNGKLQETFAVEYAGGDKLYVPVSQAHLLSRYISVGGRRAKIHRLGGGQWLREKESARKAIYDAAAMLLETQAMRETFRGFPFPVDTSWQHDFEAAFPYEETEDQEKAIADVKSDMESPVPMDRLICGDAGYGKTEVAMRAAFKAVLAGKQVALLVPTTVLALQHYEVFRQRMGDYPVRIELLCRFRSAAFQRKIIGELRRGTVDIVAGTHRLLQNDIAFKDLGLIIIDEEQRFGVVHKERLKQLKKMADVLTMTATPIPRTLYMSLAGARKISMIQTSPKMRRPIETMVAANDDRLVREAVLREIDRGGQVFYLHNRVETIDKIFKKLQKTVPEARIAVAHGRLSSRELAEKMHAFARGSFDVLLCTTIVESGVDLPNVNTILIDRADRFGLADLYQLRGRVGRSDRRAYAYLLTPVHGYLLDVSRRRLQAIMEHSSLGSGFKLAMLDLEIRGAGNLLGTEQSGHIAAIGFDLYCQLLRKAIEQIKNGGQRGQTAAAIPEPVDTEINLDFVGLAAENGESGAEAFLPISYIDDEQTRIGIYRKIAAAAAIDKINSLRAEFRDRFGPLPAPFERLLKIAAIRVKAAMKNISAVETKEDRLMLIRRGEYLQVKDQFPRLRAPQADGKLKEISEWLDRIA